MRTHQALLAALAFGLMAGASAQPSRTAYKCVKDGKTTYSDEPCLNATVVDTTPTRGLDKSTGVSRKGADVHREESHEAFADAIQPLTGMNAQQLQTATRRQKLSPAAQQECRQLDTKLPLATSDKSTDPHALLAMRKRYKTLGC